MTWSLLVRNLHHQKVNLFYIANSFQMYPTKRFKPIVKGFERIFREGKFEQESVKNHCVRYFLKYSNLLPHYTIVIQTGFEKRVVLLCKVPFTLASIYS